MDRHSFIVLVFISTLALCSCQLEGGLLNLALLAGGTGGNTGTGAGATSNGAGSGTPTNDAPLTPEEIQLAAQILEIDLGQNNGMGGGMGGMMGGMGGAGAGAGGAGMGGMMNQIDRITRTLQTMGGELGPGGISRVVRQMITPMITDKIVNQKMNELVKIVVGPHATPSQEMLDYARILQRPPSNPKETAKYISMMLEVAKKEGIFMPDGTIQKPVPEGAPSGTKGPSIDEVRGLIMKRSFMFQKSQKNKPKNTGAGTGGLGAMGAMNAMGGMGGLAGMGGFGMK